MSILQKFRQTFARHFEGCWQTETRLEFYVVDGIRESQSYIVPPTAGQPTICLTVQNPQAKTIYFVAIDHCCFSSQDKQKRCDCILFDDQTLCFVELKLEASRQPGEKLAAAREQLGATIQFLKRAFGDDFGGLSLEALAVAPKYPTHPKHLSSYRTTQVKFLESYGVKLLDWGHIKVFE